MSKTAVSKAGMTSGYPGPRPTTPGSTLGRDLRPVAVRVPCAGSLHGLNAPCL